MSAFAEATWSLAPILAVASFIAILATLPVWFVPLLLWIEARAEARRRRAAIRFAADVTATIHALPTTETS